MEAKISGTQVPTSLQWLYKCSQQWEEAGAVWTPFWADCGSSSEREEGLVLWCGLKNLQCLWPEGAVESLLAQFCHVGLATVPGSVATTSDSLVLLEIQ